MWVGGWLAEEAGMGTKETRDVRSGGNLIYADVMITRKQHLLPNFAGQTEITFYLFFGGLGALSRFSSFYSTIN